METTAVAEQLLHTGFGIHSTGETAQRLPDVTRELAARFTTLSREWQDMVIQRTAHRV